MYVQNEKNLAYIKTTTLQGFIVRMVMNINKIGCIFQIPE